MSEGPQTIGPYRILEELGRGGMGVVFRAMHLQSGQIAALKTVAIQREGVLRSIRREIHALASIDHPGVVRILDEGVHEGLPWYAMELLDGLPLRRYRDWLVAEALPPTEAPIDPAAARPPMTPTRWWTQSLGVSAAPRPSSALGGGATRSPIEGAPRALPRRTLIQVLTLVRRLCASLAYLHGEGIVHRDLKPENILITGSREWGVGRREPDNAAHPTADCLLPTALPTPFPVIVDFGLVSRFAAGLGREALDLGGEMAGTIAYMAPEQGRGEFLDARADLYSLGCILYELLTGRPPFLGTSPIHVMWQHFEDQPVPPSQLVGGVDSEVDALALRLLAKKPHDRFGYAGDVAAALGRLGAEDGLASAVPRSRDYLYRPGFAGRQEALTLLEERLSQSKHGSGGLVLLEGESGVGKTRLVMELSRIATQAGVVVLTGECLEQGGQPLEALRKPLQAIADRCRERGEPETDRLLGPRGKLLSRYEPTLAGLPGQEHHDEPAELSAEAERLRLFQSLSQTFEALSRVRPLLLILDDLQWADELTLAFGDHVLRAVALGHFAVLVVGTCRTEELGDGLRMLFRRPGLERLELGRLDEKAVASMVGDMLSLDPPPEVFSRFLTRHSEGNPFFVTEYLRAAVAEGLLWRDVHGWWQVAAPERRNAAEEDYQELPLPPSLRELVARRLQNLPARALAVLEAASVMGRDVNVLALRELVQQQEELQFLGALADLLRRQILEEGSSEELRFVHDKFKEVAYDGIAGETRRELHRAAAQMLAGKDGVASLAILGHHWERSGEVVTARDCYISGARLEARRYAHGEAERLYRAYLALVDRPTGESIAARLELADDVLHRLGQNQQAISELQQAELEALSLGDRRAGASSLRLRALIYLDTQGTGEAHELLLQALASARESGDGRLEGKVLGDLGRLHHQHGRWPEALELLEKAMAIHEQFGDLQSQVGILSNLAELHADLGDLQKAHAFYERSLEVQRALGNRARVATSLGNVANSFLWQGRLAEAQPLIEQALAIHREVGNRRSEGRCLAYLAELYAQQGRPRLARPLYEQALEIYSETGERRQLGQTLAAFARLEADDGRLQVAGSLFQKAVDASHEVNDLHYEAIARIGAAAVARRTGSFSESEALLQQADAVLRTLADPYSLTLCLCEQGHLAMSQNSQARSFLEEAERFGTSLKAAPESEPGRAVSRLRRAIEAFEAGQPLFRGELVEDFPIDLQLRMRTSGQAGEPVAFPPAEDEP